MEEFLDKKGRVIHIEADEGGATSYYEGICVGEVATTGFRQDDERFPFVAPKITYLNVDADYQRAGIGVEMIRQIFEHTGPLYPADPELGVKDKNALTIEGMALTRHCQSLGYIKPFPEDRPFDD